MLALAAVVLVTDAPAALGLVVVEAAVAAATLPVDVVEEASAVGAAPDVGALLVAERATVVVVGALAIWDAVADVTALVADAAPEDVTAFDAVPALLQELRRRIRHSIIPGHSGRGR
jgi:hypothetical protein